MKIAQINTCHYGSTGKIMLSIANAANLKGHSVCTFSRSWYNQKSPNDKHYFFGSFIDNAYHRIMGPVTGYEGFFSKRGTRELLRKLDAFSPDIIHIHNLHGWYIDFKMLFDYIKEKKIRTVWTLHDCWAFTGHCPHFEMENCNKWRTQCNECPKYIQYPYSLLDNSKKMYNFKKACFGDVEEMTIVTPSQWLSDLTKQSFLKKHQIKVINNGIDLNIFKPTVSDFKQRYGLENKKIVLGVAFDWGYAKGIDVFIELASRLPDQYRVVLVGTTSKTDKLLPDNVTSIHRTHNQIELAEIYTAADVFVNPTREDNFPTVNIEALACGTPVVTFKTGGSPEIIDMNTGVVVEKDDIDAMEATIKKICSDDFFSPDACVSRAALFDKNKMFEKYMELYEIKY